MPDCKMAICSHHRWGKAGGAMYLAMEPALDKKGAAETMAKFTKEQLANIALLRKLGPAAYTLD